MAFIPRLTENTPTPMQGNPWYYSNNWFSQNGWGPPAISGNCTWYAYGRFNEIAETVCDLPLGDAGTWWTDPRSSAFRKGSIPALGAIACWATTDSSLSGTAPGHVAIVEQINADGSIVISESGYRAWYFNTETLTEQSGYVSSWMTTAYRKYALQGFIYNPASTSLAWHAKDGAGWVKEDPEAYENALIIYNTLYAYGWTLNAVCGLLGSIDIESMYNPWLWEGFSSPASTDYSIIHGSRGYGLVQWTPASGYIGDSVAMASPYYSPHFSDIVGNPDDGYAQLYAIENQTGQYYATTAYPETYAEYRLSTQTPEYLASAWMFNYERPYIDPSSSDPGYENRRRTAARYWYDLLVGVTPGPGPTPPTPPSPTPTLRKLPLWFYLKRY